jgi:signal peptidase II
MATVPRKSQQAFETRKIISFGLAASFVILASIALDLTSKLLAQNYLMIHEDPANLHEYSGRQWPLFTLGEGDAGDGSPFLAGSFNYVRNFGAAWGLLSNLPEQLRLPFFSLVTLLSTLVIVLMLRSARPEDLSIRWALVLILSGAFGNFINRLSHGYVIDWIDVQWRIFGWSYAFPNFNWADICITLGVFLYLFSMLWPRLHAPPA